MGGCGVGVWGMGGGGQKTPAAMPSNNGRKEKEGRKERVDVTSKKKEISINIKIY